MNRQQLRSALRLATTATFEELALLVVESTAADRVDGAPCIDGAPRVDGVHGAGARPACGVRVDFAGPWSGSVVVRVAESVLDASAANMLGIACAPDALARRDALGELANVICGNVLPAIAGRAAVFALRAPRWIGAADAACAVADARVACTLAADEGDLEVELHVPGYLVVDDAPEPAVA